MKQVLSIAILLLCSCQQRLESSSANNAQAMAAQQHRSGLASSKLRQGKLLRLRAPNESGRRLDGAGAALPERDLFDPFSARFVNVRAGRTGAICGQYNARNRYGAYVGFKDFVVGQDGQTLYTSQHNDGVRSELFTSFAEAYLNACATSSEVAQYRRLTGVSGPAEFRASLRRNNDDVMMDANAMDNDLKWIDRSAT